MPAPFAVLSFGQPDETSMHKVSDKCTVFGQQNETQGD
jgi:hypothetical protein